MTNVLETVALQKQIMLRIRHENTRGTASVESFKKYSREAETECAEDGNML